MLTLATLILGTALTSPAAPREPVAVGAMAEAAVESAAGQLRDPFASGSPIAAPAVAISSPLRDPFRATDGGERRRELEAGAAAPDLRDPFAAGRPTAVIAAPPLQDPFDRRTTVRMEGQAVPMQRPAELPSFTPPHGDDLRRPAPSFPAPSPGLSAPMKDPFAR